MPIIFYFDADSFHPLQKRERRHVIAVPRARSGSHHWWHRRRTRWMGPLQIEPSRHQLPHKILSKSPQESQPKTLRIWRSPLSSPTPAARRHLRFLLLRSASTGVGRRREADAIHRRRAIFSTVTAPSLAAACAAATNDSVHIGDEMTTDSCGRSRCIFVSLAVSSEEPPFADDAAGNLAGSPPLP